MDNLEKELKKKNISMEKVKREIDKKILEKVDKFIQERNELNKDDTEYWEILEAKSKYTGKMNDNEFWIHIDKRQKVFEKILKDMRSEKSISIKSNNYMNLEKLLKPFAIQMT